VVTGENVFGPTKNSKRKTKKGGVFRNTIAIAQRAMKIRGRDRELWRTHIGLRENRYE
jgi:hypothetical protein